MKRDAEFVSYQHEDVTIDFQIKTSKQTMCLKTANVQQTMRNPKCEHKKIRLFDHIIFHTCLLACAHAINVSLACMNHSDSVICLIL